MIIENQNLVKYRFHSQKYTGYVSELTHKHITILDIMANGESGIVLKCQRFNISKTLFQYIQIYGIVCGNIVEFYASVDVKEVASVSKIYTLNRICQIEVLGLRYVY